PPAAVSATDGFRSRSRRARSPTASWAPATTTPVRTPSTTICAAGPGDSSTSRRTGSTVPGSPSTGFNRRTRRSRSYQRVALLCAGLQHKEVEGAWGNREVPPKAPRSAEKGARHVVPVLRHRLQLGGRLLERDVDDRVSVERRHPPEAPFVDEVGRLQPVTGREDAVARRRRAAALDVAEDGDARLVTGALLDLSRQPVADAALGQSDVPELVDLALVRQALQLVALADDHDREVLAALVPPPDVRTGFLDRDRMLRDQDHVGPAGNPAHDRDPSRVPAHHL